MRQRKSRIKTVTDEVLFQFLCVDTDWRLVAKQPRRLAVTVISRVSSIFIVIIVVYGTERRSYLQYTRRVFPDFAATLQQNTLLIYFSIPCVWLWSGFSTAN